MTMDLDDDFAQFERELAQDAAIQFTKATPTVPPSSDKDGGAGKVVISAAAPVIRGSNGENWKEVLQRRDLEQQARGVSRIPDRETKVSPRVAEHNSANHPRGKITERNTNWEDSQSETARDVNGDHGGKPKKAHVRTAAGTVWRDTSLAEWPESDFRIFVGDLGKDATDLHLVDAFKQYKSFNKAKAVTDKRTGLCKGYGFVSFGKGEDMIQALKQMNGRYIAGRPVKLKKSNWQKRELTRDKKMELRLYKQITKYR